MKTNLQHKRGQNTAEYLIMLTLIAVGSIGLVTVLGGQVRNKLSMATAALSGDTTSYGKSLERAGKDGVAADKMGSKGSSMKGVEASEVGAYGGEGGTE